MKKAAKKKWFCY